MASVGGTVTRSRGTNKKAKQSNKTWARAQAFLTAPAKKVKPGAKITAGEMVRRAIGGAKPAAKAGARPSKKVSKPAPKTPAKTGKAAPNKAKAAYKAATSKAREAKMMAGGRTSARGLGKRQDAGAQRIRASVKAVQAAQAKVRAMEKKRGVGGRKRKG
jgi:hypothetical protein